jgi:hypothetical protein
MALPAALDVGSATAELEVPKSIAQNVVMAGSVAHNDESAYARKGWEGRALYHESAAPGNRGTVMRRLKEKRAAGPRVLSDLSAPAGLRFTCRFSP